MLVSMTGFASAEKEVELEGLSVQISVEMKSLNSRYFEGIVKLPPRLNFIERDLVQALRSRLVRGRAFVVIHVEGDSAVFEEVRVSENILRAYIDGVKAVKENFGLPGEFGVREALEIPGIFTMVGKKPSEELVEAVKAVFEKALEKLVEFREEEGERLERDILLRFKKCSELASRLRELFEHEMEQKKEELMRHQQEMATAAKEGENAAEQEWGGNVAYEALNKIDINEELVRISSHIRAAIETIDGEGLEKGKKLDFILQELSREINTAAAKSSSYEIASLAVDMKVELEKIREQVQNVV